MLLPSNWIDRTVMVALVSMTIGIGIGFVVSDIQHRQLDLKNFDFDVWTKSDSGWKAVEVSCTPYKTPPGSRCWELREAPDPLKPTVRQDRPQVKPRGLWSVNRLFAGL